MWRTVLFMVTLFTAPPVCAETLYISTEDYPPYNLRGADGKPTGVYLDQLKIIFERTGINYETTILPWARALALAETKPMHCVVAAARTHQREKLFKWVSPIHTDRNVLVALKDAQLTVDNLDDAKQYTVGTQRNDYTETLLESLKFPRIDLSADFDKTLAKLVAGRIDMMPMSESALNNLPKSQFSEVIVLAHQSLGMACNKSVPDDLIKKMQDVLDDIIADGTQRSIYEKHGLIVRP
jgi:polar amino acid transport system substrate-binding protein